jgi:D-amino peptidase
MKVFISADMEGISGIVSKDEVNAPGGKDYPASRKAMTKDVNAAIEGALAAGAKEVYVRDSHADMTNIIPEELESPAVLIKGSPSPLSMVEALDETFDCLFLVGYHSMSGSLCSVLDHTYSGRCVSELRLNGKASGEFAMSAMVAGHHGIPVAFISGDRVAVEQAKELVPNIVGVEVKRAITRYSAACLHPGVARERIWTGSRDAIELVKGRKIKPFVIKPPVEVELDLISAGMADAASQMPSSRRKGARTVAYTAPNVLEAYKAIICAITLASAP